MAQPGLFAFSPVSDTALNLVRRRSGRETFGIFWRLLSYYHLPETDFSPYSVELLPEIRVSPGVDGWIITGAGHGHHVAEEEHQVVELPTF